MNYRYIKYTVSLLALTLAILLRLHTDYKVEYMAMLILPTIMIPIQVKEGLKNDIIYNSLFMIIVFLFWGHFYIADILLTLIGGIIALSISVITRVLFSNKA